MKVYLFQRKKKRHQILKWAYFAFIGLWTVSFASEFLLPDPHLYHWLIPTSLLPLSLIIGFQVVRFFRHPFVKVSSAKGLRLRLNTKVPFDELYKTEQLALTANYLYSDKFGPSVLEITRKSALRLARTFPLMEIELVPERPSFDHTTTGIWLIYLAKVFLGVFFVSILFFGFVIYPYFTNTLMVWEKPAAVESVMEWGGLAELPVGLSQMDIRTEGSMFTRTFIIEFEADSAQIGQWIEQSFGIQDPPQVQVDGRYIYVSPGFEGAFGGQVIVDYDTDSVFIKMSWS